MPLINLVMFHQFQNKKNPIKMNIMNPLHKKWPHDTPEISAHNIALSLITANSKLFRYKTNIHIHVLYLFSPHSFESFMISISF